MNRADPTCRLEIRQRVRNLLTQSSAFMQMTADNQHQVIDGTALIAEYLAAPMDFPAHNLHPANVPESDLGQDKESTGDALERVSEIADRQNQGDIATERAELAASLVRQLDFQNFVENLVQGVFQALVDLSIKQLEAYLAMIALTTQLVEKDKDDGISENQCRDYIAEAFADLFDIDFADASGLTVPRLRLLDGVDRSEAIRRVNSHLGPFKSIDAPDENLEKALVFAATTRLVRDRRQLLATLVLMGINRIVVTGGSINIPYVFRIPASPAPAGSSDAYTAIRDDALQATHAREAELVGKVDINFKSDFLPLSKLATQRVTDVNRDISSLPNCNVASSGEEVKGPIVPPISMKD